MTYPKMTTTTVESTPTTIVLDVHHHIGQSWSRAVDPRAMRAARVVIGDRSDRGARWELFDTDYGHGERGPDETRTTSRYYFRKA